MTTKNRVSNMIQWLQVAGVCAVFTGCMASKDNSESETHFLECETNADCVDEAAGFVCYEERCTDPATLEATDSSSETDDSSADDTADDTDGDTFEETSENTDDDTASADEGNAQADETAAESTDDGEEPVDCSGPGHYQRGKAPNPPGCCEGLSEVLFLDGYYEGEDMTPVCGEPAGHANFACVAGECGDGTCEPGEDVACGCVEDCPGAVWEETEGNAGADASVSPELDAASSEPTETIEGGSAVGGSCSAVGTGCEVDDECQALDPTLRCAVGYCVPSAAAACGGAAGWGCETEPALTCVTLVGDAGVCLDTENAACFCENDAGFSCYTYPPSGEDAGAAN